jgi:hypothetical protein
MSIPTNRTRTIVLSLILVIGLLTVVFALKMRQDSPKPKQHQAFVEETQPEPAQPVEEKQAEQPVAPPGKAKPDGKLHVDTAAYAIFRAFSVATWMCWDDASHTYFVYFSSEESQPKFGYHQGWNIMGAFSFIVLDNGTAALKMAGNFSPIVFDNKGLNCVERDTK